MKKNIAFNTFMAEVPIIIETSLLICSANQWNGFSMIGITVVKELRTKQTHEPSSI